MLKGRLPTSLPSCRSSVGILRASAGIAKPRRSATQIQRTARGVPGERAGPDGAGPSENEVDLLDQFLAGRIAHHLVPDLTRLEEQDGRDREDSVRDGGRLGLVHVEV